MYPSERPNKEIKEALQSCAKASEAINVEHHPWQSYEYYSKWRGNIDLAVIDHGGGEHTVIFISDESIFVREYDPRNEVRHYWNDDIGESECPPEMFIGAPEEFMNLLAVDATNRDTLQTVLNVKDPTWLDRGWTNSCFWRKNAERSWQHGEVPYDEEDMKCLGLALMTLHFSASEFIKFSSGSLDIISERSGIARTELEKRIHQAFE